MFSPILLFFSCAQQRQHAAGRALGHSRHIHKLGNGGAGSWVYKNKTDSSKDTLIVAVEYKYKLFLSVCLKKKKQYCGGWKHEWNTFAITDTIISSLLFIQLLQHKVMGNTIHVFVYLLWAPVKRDMLIRHGLHRPNGTEDRELACITVWAITKPMSFTVLNQ